MTEETFEEQFPSLKGKDFRITYSGKKTKPYGDEYLDHLRKKDIQTHCLDKQKVRDAIDVILQTKTVSNWKDLKHSGGFIKYNLLKELNLGDEE